MSNLEKMLSKVGDLNFRRRIVKMLEYLEIDAGDKVLDAGCGEGFYSMLLSRLYGCQITALDSDISILSKGKLWLGNNDRVEFKVSDLTNTQLVNESYDKVLCTEVLEHIPDDLLAAKERYRVLKRNGTLALTVPNKNYPFIWDPLNKIRESLGLGHFNSKSEILGGIWAYDHKRLYTADSIESLLKEAGFTIETTEALTHYGIPFNHLLLVLGKRLYTSLPVSEDIRRSMEKFEWNSDSEYNHKSIFSRLTSFALKLMLMFDRLNDREFSRYTPTMAIAVKARKL